MMDKEYIEKVKKYAITCHKNVNHQYDGNPYSVHLNMVYNFALKYLYLLPNSKRTEALASAYTHDLIEDCRETYNDVLKVCGKEVAEITYALTNEKGRNRAERANEKYYDGINDNIVAIYVKICDRLANATYSKNSGSSMFKKYKIENENFVNHIYFDRYESMFNELTNLFIN